MNQLYLERYGYPKTFIASLPPDDLNLVITIPCYNEPYLLGTLNSLAACTLPQQAVEVLIIINEAENADSAIRQQNTTTYSEASDWAAKHNSDKIRFHLVHEQLPAKHAGVGLARKAIMDEAYRRLAGTGNETGVIVGLDADSLVDTNYLVEIERYFNENPDKKAASIYYEHPLQGDLEPCIYEGIVLYELHLRYYVHAQRRAGYPHAYQTIGSAMAVRTKDYAKQGGMNRRKAAEDFYFLHKFIPLGGFGEINTTRVIPSPRISDRVPFGTGKAVGQFVHSQELLSYDPRLFDVISTLMASLPAIYDGNTAPAELLLPFLETLQWDDRIKKLRTNSSSFEGFKQQFYRWFDGLKMLKLVHYLRDQHYPGIPVVEATRRFLDQPAAHGHDLLVHFRKLDQN